MKCTQICALLFFLFIQLFVQATELKEGSWVGTLNLQNSHQLSFHFEVGKNQEIIIKNGKEWIEMKSYEYQNDSIKVYFSNFPNYLIFKVDSLNQEKLSGYFVNPDRKKHSKIELTAKFYEYFGIEDIGDEIQNIDGNWQVTFAPNTEDEYPAIGKFKQSYHGITGTFLTETGDYRYLRGTIIDNKLTLTSFDGAHVFLFTATLENDTLKGEFLSGNHWKTNWIGYKNDNFKLDNPDSLRYMVKDDFKFNFKTTDGEDYVYPNSTLKGKVVIIQILGSWCPNCLDETHFYKELYKKFNSHGLEIIGISYETPDNFEEQVKRIKRFKENKNVPYKILVGGKASKENSSKDFYMLNKISSFPTSIFINKNGEIVKIHTGFNGPGTGEIYEKYKAETLQLISRLLKE